MLSLSFKMSTSVNVNIIITYEVHLSLTLPLLITGLIFSWNVGLLYALAKFNGKYNVASITENRNFQFVNCHVIRTTQNLA